MGSIPTIFRAILCHRLLWYSLAWLLALGSAWLAWHHAYHSFDAPKDEKPEKKRPDGNDGHVSIDFGGQYLMGRMLLEGHGRHLYDRNYLRSVLIEIYPLEDQVPEAPKSDAENLLYWMMGSDDAAAPPLVGSFLLPLAAPDLPGSLVYRVVEQQHWRAERPETVASCLTPLAATDPVSAVSLVAAGHPETVAERLKHVTDKRVGGALYPPINAFLSALLALMPARTAYHANQFAAIVLVFVAGLGVSFMTRRRIWWPVATFFIIIFPGFMASINLGQNAMLTLTILIWGWALIVRGRPVCGGAVWGLLAFKPVWALAFFLVPLLMRRWRVCAAMVGTGLLLALLTLPVVGYQSWLDWLKVGKEAAELYTTDHNWIFLSRDLLGLPRRYLLNWEEGAERQPVWYPPDAAGPGLWWHVVFGSRQLDGWIVPTLLGWGLLLGALEITLRLAVLRKAQARAATGIPAGFLLLGAWLCCYHFMYYDVLLGALPVFVLFAEPERYLRPIYLAIVPLGPQNLGHDLADYYRPWPFAGAPPPVPLLRAGYRNIWVFNRMLPTLTVVLLSTQFIFPHIGLGSYYSVPWDTLCLIAMWLWCGGLWLWHRELPAARPT
jgi:arabinofuranan 3-O-arabinosyltransferase